MINTYQVTGGPNDDYPVEAFSGVGTPSGNFNGNYIYNIPDNDYGIGIGKIFWLASVEKWFITYNDIQPTDGPPPTDGFISATNDITSSYSPQGYWADSHSGNLTVTVKDTYGGFRWSGFLSYELYPPIAQIQIGTSNFSMCYWCNASYANPNHINFLTFLMGTNVNFPGGGPVSGNVVELGLEPNFGPFRIWGYIANTNGTPSPAAQVVYENFDWNGKDLFLVLTVDRLGLLKMYVNNSLVGSADATLFKDVNFAPNYAGFVNSGAPNGWEGNVDKIDQFRFYKDTVLTPTQISAMWNDGHGADIVQSEFAAITSNGLYSEFNDLQSVPTGSEIISGIWTNNTNWTAQTFLHPQAMGFELGGVPLMNGEELELKENGMAVQLVTTNNYTQEGRWYAQATGDLSGCEVLKAAVTGQSHYITKIVLTTASAINISIGEGESSSNLVTTLVGPVYFTTGGPGVWTLDLGDNPIKLTAATLLAVDSSGSGNATAIVVGFTS